MTVTCCVAGGGGGGGGGGGKTRVVGDCVIALLVNVVVVLEVVVWALVRLAVDDELLAPLEVADVLLAGTVLAIRPLAVLAEDDGKLDEGDLLRTTTTTSNATMRAAPTIAFLTFSPLFADGF